MESVLIRPGRRRSPAAATSRTHTTRNNSRKNLTDLDLGVPNVTDQGLLQFADPKSLPNLHTLRIRAPRVPDPVRNAIRAARPTLKLIDP
jgi:hypothetical protein